MTHFHGNRRENGGAPAPIGGLADPSREGVYCAVLQQAGRRLQETGWQVEECDLPREGLGHVRLWNLATGEEISWSVWGCTCEQGERDVRGLAPYPARRVKAPA